MKRTPLVVTVGVTQFATKRHHADSRFSHFEGNWDQVCAAVKEALLRGLYCPGRVGGSYVAHITPPDGFHCRDLDGRKLDGQRHKLSAQSVDVVVYERAALGSYASTGADVEIVSLHAWELRRDLDLATSAEPLTASTSASL